MARGTGDRRGSGPSTLLQQSRCIWAGGPRSPCALVTIEARAWPGSEISVYNGTTWSTVRGASEAPGSAFDVATITAHIPGTDATWAVGFYGNSDATAAGRGIIEFNPG
jgi:hypothetical protein